MSNNISEIIGELGMEKTTIAAILAAVGILIKEAGFFFDADPATTTNFNMIVTAVGSIIAALGITGLGLFARDKKMSDEQAGAGRID